MAHRRNSTQQSFRIKRHSALMVHMRCAPMPMRQNEPHIGFRLIEAVSRSQIKENKAAKVTKMIAGKYLCFTVIATRLVTPYPIASRCMTPR